MFRCKTRPLLHPHKNACLFLSTMLKLSYTCPVLKHKCHKLLGAQGPENTMHKKLKIKAGSYAK